MRTSPLVIALPHTPVVGKQQYATQQLPVAPGTTLLPVTFDFSQAINGLAGEVISTFQVNGLNPMRVIGSDGSGASAVQTNVLAPIADYDQTFSISCNARTNFFQQFMAFTSFVVPAGELGIYINADNVNIPAGAPLGSVVATLHGEWSDGRPFAGNFSFAAPYFNDGGIFAITQSTPGAVGYLIINPSGPGVGPGASIQNVTVVANDPPA